VNRARGLLQVLPEGPAHGYLFYLDASLALSLANLGPARETAAKLQEMGRSLRAPALTSLSLVLAGLADPRSGNTASGFAQLDEAMLPVLAGRLPPEWQEKSSASLLQHAAGKNEAAWAGLCAALAGRDRLACARLLMSGVEIALALGHLDEAERLCARLEETAAVFATAGFPAG
jgi:hypothetical protein